jgi:hypothetical protein
VAALNECVHAVLYSSTEVYFSDIVQLNEIFKTDYGRRQFAFALKQTMKKVRNKRFLTPIPSSNSDLTHSPSQSCDLSCLRSVCRRTPST